MCQWGWESTWSTWFPAVGTAVQGSLDRKLRPLCISDYEAAFELHSSLASDCQDPSTQRVQIECHYGITAPETYGFRDLIP